MVTVTVRGPHPRYRIIKTVHQHSQIYNFYITISLSAPRNLGSPSLISFFMVTVLQKPTCHTPRFLFQVFHSVWEALKNNTRNGLSQDFLKRSFAPPETYPTKPLSNGQSNSRTKSTQQKTHVFSLKQFSKNNLGQKFMTFSNVSNSFFLPTKIRMDDISQPTSSNLKSLRVSPRYNDLTSWKREMTGWLLLSTKRVELVGPLRKNWHGRFHHGNLEDHGYWMGDGCRFHVNLPGWNCWCFVFFNMWTNLLRSVTKWGRKYHPKIFIPRHLFLMFLCLCSASWYFQCWSKDVDVVDVDVVDVDVVDVDDVVDVAVPLSLFRFFGFFGH